MLKGAHVAISFSGVRNMGPSKFNVHGFQLKPSSNPGKATAVKVHCGLPSPHWSLRLVSSPSSPSLKATALGPSNCGFAGGSMQVYAPGLCLFLPCA